jgi:MFS family permease
MSDEGKDKRLPLKNGAPYMLGLGRNVFYVGLVSLFMDVSSEMVYPLVPLFLTGVLGATRTTVGVIEGIAEATASILKVFSGWLSDRLGKRKLLMGVGYGVSVLSRPVIANAGTWLEVLSARFIDRFGKGVRTAPRDAIIADSTTTAKLGAAFGFHRTMDTIGATIGPALAFVLLYFYTDNLRLVFYASTVPAVIAVLVIVFFVKEKRPGGVGGPRGLGTEAGAEGRGGRGPEERQELPRLSISSFNGPFRHYIVVIGIFSLATFSDAFLILRAANLGIDKGLITVVYLLFNVVYAVSSTPMGILADRVGLKRMVLLGFVFYSVIFAAIGSAYAPLHMWVLFPLYGVYKGMSVGAQRAYLASLAPIERKATAFGVYHMVVGLMLLPASIIAGLLWDAWGPGAAFYFGSALSLLAAVYFAFGSMAGGKRGTAGG